MRLRKDCFVLLDSLVGWAHNLSKGHLGPLGETTDGQESQEPKNPSWIQWEEGKESLRILQPESVKKKNAKQGKIAAAK